jgi:hypothetical protein
MNLNRVTPMRSLQNLNSFSSRNVEENSKMIRNTEERRSPYYYNELTQVHAANSSQFVPISNGNMRDENFIDFINTIHPQG